MSIVVGFIVMLVFLGLLTKAIDILIDLQPEDSWRKGFLIFFFALKSICLWVVISLLAKNDYSIGYMVLGAFLGKAVFCLYILHRHDKAPNH